METNSNNQQLNDFQNNLYNEVCNLQRKLTKLEERYNRKDLDSKDKEITFGLISKVEEHLKKIKKR